MKLMSATRDCKLPDSTGKPELVPEVPPPDDPPEEEPPEDAGGVVDDSVEQPPSEVSRRRGMRREVLKFMPVKLANGEPEAQKVLQDVFRHPQFIV